MLQAPTTDRKTKADASAKTAEPLPEQEQSLQLLGGLGQARQSQPLQQRDNLAGLQKAYGNQAVLRMKGRSPIANPVPGGILQRKCACGNSAGAAGTCTECQAKQGLALQTKLKISEPGDVYEQEADRVADQVLATPIHPSINATPLRIQRYTQTGTETEAVPPSSVHRVLSSPGRPLEPALRQDMERRFSYDFSQIRVYTDSAAAESAQEIDAHAYTMGQKIIFGAAQYAPHSTIGRRLIAHELTHTIQQEATRTVVQRQHAQDLGETIETNPLNEILSFAQFHRRYPDVMSAYERLQDAVFYLRDTFEEHGIGPLPPLINASHLEENFRNAVNRFLEADEEIVSQVSFPRMRYAVEQAHVLLGAAFALIQFQQRHTRFGLGGSLLVPTTLSLPHERALQAWQEVSRLMGRYEESERVAELIREPSPRRRTRHREVVPDEPARREPRVGEAHLVTQLIELSETAQREGHDINLDTATIRLQRLVQITAVHALREQLSQLSQRYTAMREEIRASSEDDRATLITDINNANLASQRAQDLREQLQSDIERAERLTIISNIPDDWQSIFAEIVVPRVFLDPRLSEQEQLRQPRDPVPREIAALLARGRGAPYQLLAFGTAQYLISRRQEQLQALNRGISEIHEHLPFLEYFQENDVVVSAQNLEQQVTEGIGEAIRSNFAAQRVVMTGSISPFAMAGAITAAAEVLPGRLRSLLEQVSRHEQEREAAREFAIAIGGGALSVLLAMVPVFGPVLSFAVGTALFARTELQFANQEALAEASLDPEGQFLGVGAPGNVERWLNRLGMILEVVGLAAVPLISRAQRSFSATGRLEDALTAGERGYVAATRGAAARSGVDVPTFLADEASEGTGRMIRSGESPNLPPSTRVPDSPDAAGTAERIADTTPQRLTDATEEELEEVAPVVSITEARRPRGPQLRQRSREPVTSLEEARLRRQAPEPPPTEPVSAERPIELPQEQELQVAAGQDFSSQQVTTDLDRSRATAGSRGSSGAEDPTPPVTVVERSPTPLRPERSIEPEVTGRSVPDTEIVADDLTLATRQPEIPEASDQGTSAELVPEEISPTTYESQSRRPGMTLRERHDEIRREAAELELEAYEALQSISRERSELNRQIVEVRRSIRRARAEDSNGSELTELLEREQSLLEEAESLTGNEDLSEQWLRARQRGQAAEVEYLERLTSRASRRSGHTTVRARGHDEVFGTDSTDLTVEHIVPRSRIATMPGFENLSPEQQVALFDWEPNLRLMPREANSARGTRRYAGWSWGGRTPIENLARLESVLEKQIRRMIANPFELNRILDL